MKIFHTGHIFTAAVSRYAQADVIPPSVICHQRRADTYLFLYLCGGKISLSVDQQQYRMNPGDAVLLCSNNTYEIKDLGSRSTDLSMTAFSLEKQMSLVADYRCPCIRRDMHELSPMISHLDHYADTKGRDDECTCAAFLLILDRFLHAHELAHEGEYLFRLSSEYIRKHVREALTPQSVSRALRYHENYLSRSVKAYSGVTLSFLIVQEKIHTAKNYLALTTYSMEKIAHLLGYPSSTVFARFFKYHTGISPKAYRQSCENLCHEE